MDFSNLMKIMHEALTLIIIKELWSFWLILARLCLRHTKMRIYVVLYSFGECSYVHHLAPLDTIVVIFWSWISQKGVVCRLKIIILRIICHFLYKKKRSQQQRKTVESFVFSMEQIFLYFVIISPSSPSSNEMMIAKGFDRWKWSERNKFMQILCILSKLCLGRPRYLLII